MRDGLLGYRGEVAPGEVFKAEHMPGHRCYLRRIAVPDETFKAFPAGTLQIGTRPPIAVKLERKERLNDLGVLCTLQPEVDLDMVASYADLEVCEADVVRVVFANTSGDRATFTGCTLYRCPTPDDERQKVEWAICESEPVVVPPRDKVTVTIRPKGLFKCEHMRVLNGHDITVDSFKISNEESMAMPAPAAYFNDSDTPLLRYSYPCRAPSAIEVVIRNESGEPVTTVVKLEGVEHDESKRPPGLPSAVSLFEKLERNAAYGEIDQDIGTATDDDLYDEEMDDE